jgi:hypothetical protein
MMRETRAATALILKELKRALETGRHSGPG